MSPSTAYWITPTLVTSVGLESEPNNSAAQGQLLNGSSGVVCGGIWGQDFEDYFTLNLPQNKLVKLDVLGGNSMAGNYSCSGQPQLSLQVSDGSNSTSIPSTFGERTSGSFTSALTSGVYNLRLVDAASGATQSVGYCLSWQTR
jgi:hypothetical protein